MYTKTYYRDIYIYQRSIIGVKKKGLYKEFQFENIRAELKEDEGNMEEEYKYFRCRK